MKIGIIGGGSIGLLFAFYLSERYEVTIYTNTHEQAMALNQNGLHLIKNGHEQDRFVHSESFEQWSGKEDLTIIAVKQYHLEFLLPDILKKQKSNTDFVFLQNGMGHLQYLNLFKQNTIYICSVEHGSYKKNLFTIEHNGIGQSKFALYQGNKALPDSFFSITDFPVVLENDYFDMLLSKLIANAIINPLTALLKVANGEIAGNKYYFAIASSLFDEIEGVFNLENGEDYFHQVMNICKNTSSNRSSMLKDLEANRPTEVDAIIGYILGEAEKKKIKAPICQTLYYAIKGSEKKV